MTTNPDDCSPFDVRVQQETFEGIHKPRGQLLMGEGRGGYPNDHFITTAFFSKSDHEGEGVINTLKSDHVVYGCPLCSEGPINMS